MLLLDASKAFDRIEYVRLFTLLRLRNMCPLVLRLIMNMYISQRMQVRFSTARSSHFNTHFNYTKRHDLVLLHGNHSVNQELVYVIQTCANRGLDLKVY